MQTLVDLVARHWTGDALEFALPDGRHWQFGSGPPAATVTLRDRSTLLRILRNPFLAFGETYMDGEWEPRGGDLAQVLKVCARHADGVHVPLIGAESLRRALSWVGEVNSERRARSNVHHHYDVDYDVFRRFLDEDLHYSCAYFRDAEASLEQAQQAKCAHLAAKLQLRPGSRVLDIGCGWGSLAMYLAEHCGVHCLGIKLSGDQLKIARDRARRRGLADRVEFRLQDYRDVRGCFDAIVSVGMFEHVGRPQYQHFFEQLSDLLAADGVAVLHTIGRYSPPGGINPWIRKHIFPGGYIPAASEVFAAIESSGLLTCDLELWRLHYARTLEQWNERFQTSRPAIAARMGERFCRMWEFYLLACAANFRYSDLVVFQFQMAKSIDRLPLTRDYLYPPRSLRENAVAARSLRVSRSMAETSEAPVEREVDRSRRSNRQRAAGAARPDKKSR